MGRWRRASRQNVPPAEGSAPGPSGWPGPHPESEPQPEPGSDGAPARSEWREPESEAEAIAVRSAWEPPPAAPDQDVLNLGDTPPRPPRRPHSPARRVLPRRKKPEPVAFRARLRGWALDPRAWVTMLLVGVLIGATGAHFYEVQTQRDAIVLSARVALEDTAGGGGRAYWLLPIVVTNSGPEPVRIRSARLSEGPFQSGLRPVSENTEISPGSDTAISLRVTGGCAGGGPEVAPHWLVLSVVPDGRPARDIKVRLADDGGRFLATARQTCLDTDFGLWLSTEVTGDGVVTGNALLIKLRFRRNGDRPLGVSALRTTAPGLIAVAQPLPVAFQDDQSPPVGLLWTVSDCAQARGIGYDQIRLRAGITLPPGGGPVAEVNVLLYGDAVLAVVRFVLRSCG